MAAEDGTLPEAVITWAHAAASTYTDRPRLACRIFDRVEKREPERDVGARLAGEAALRVGLGLGGDVGKLDATEALRYRMRALHWFKRELAKQVRRLEDPADRVAARLEIRVLEEMVTLAPIRDSRALAAREPEERRAWESFWAEVAAVLRAAGEDR